MSQFILTPVNIDFLNGIVRNPFTRQWTLPVLTFNTAYTNPFFGEIDPLNDDKHYQKRVIEHMYTRLTERWLYRDPIFRKLLKYFKVERDGNKVTISLLTDPNKIKDNVPDKQYRKFIFRYIEKYFINHHFVAKVLREYVKTKHIKWYDLFNNTDTLKELFAHKLKKLIVSTVYELQDANQTDTTNKTIEPKKSKT